MASLLSEASPMERYGHNLTMLAQQGAFSPLVGQDAVISRIFQILQRNKHKHKPNPMLVTVDEARRWAIVAEVVRRIATGAVPDPFPPIQQVFMLDYEALFANLSDDTVLRQECIKNLLAPLTVKTEQGEPGLETAWTLLGASRWWPSPEEWLTTEMVLARLQSMFTAMREAAGAIVLFVDHFHRLVGGEWDSYPIDAAVLLKPALARREIQLIGACTLEHYRQYVERDAALQRRFQEVCLQTDR